MRRFLLPYERHMKGEGYKPMSVTERRRLKSKNNSTSDAETSESASESGKSSPTPSTSSAIPTTPTTPVDNKVSEITLTKMLFQVRFRWFYIRLCNQILFFLLFPNYGSFYLKFFNLILFKKTIHCLTKYFLNKEFSLLVPI